MGQAQFERVAEALKGPDRGLSSSVRKSMPATVMPGFTHLQAAQPVTFGHHCMAYVETFASRPVARPVTPSSA